MPMAWEHAASVLFVMTHSTKCPLDLDPIKTLLETSLAIHWLKLCLPMGSLLAQMVNNMPAMQETLVQSLGWEDPLEEGMATHSSILA